ncbi:MAG: hypothetical protein EXR32_02765 [Betaproteobacteria bacterium]|nr:hypothetical protein [Betaproteobacteria bacterium]
MTAYFIVRAQVVDAAAKDDFDRWYRDEHLPDALKAFKAQRASRGWSEMEPSVHYAFYEFDDVAGVRAIQGSDGLKRLVAEFDRAWGDRVKRSRDIVEIIQTVGGA